MIDCSRLEELVDDYVDGRLDDGLSRRVERHAADCASCARAVDELRELRRAVAGLPRELAPARDLFPGIRAGLERRRSAVRMRWVAVAASLVVLSAAAWTGLSLLRPSPTGEVATLAPGGALPAATVDLAAFATAEAEYERATGDLLRILDERRGELSPETQAIVEENLRIIDEAIAEVRDALDAGPGDARNGHLLNALHRQKVEFLWRVSRLSS